MHTNETRLLAKFATRRAGNALVKRHIDRVMTELRTALQCLAPPPPEPQVRVVEGNAHFSIRAEIRAFSPDLVALGTHARSPAASAFFGSFARDLLAELDCDVLIAAPERI